MATNDLDLLGALTAPDASGKVAFEPLEVSMTLATADFGTLQGCTMQSPAGADIGIYGKFNVPTDYASTPIIVARGFILEAANTLAFAFKQLPIADSEPADVAFEAEDLGNKGTWAGYAIEDMLELTFSITPSAYNAGEEVLFFFCRDDNVDTQGAASDFILTGLFLRYTTT